MIKCRDDHDNADDASGDGPPPGAVGDGLSSQERSLEERKALTSAESYVRYHAVARRLQQCLDLFSSNLSALPKGKRFVAPQGRGSDMRERVRNDMRTYALGCYAALGRDVGLITTELYGREKGRTLLEELHPLHSATVQSAVAKFDALREDGSEVGRLVAERYARILASALAEVERGIDKVRRRSAAAA